jgi:hypothetical protein
VAQFSVGVNIQRRKDFKLIRHLVANWCSVITG